MFINVNGTVAKKPRQVGDKFYKVANQCLYPAGEKTEVVYLLEIYRVNKTRIKITGRDGQVQIGYVRHAIKDEHRFPVLVFRSNCRKEHPIPFLIDRIEPTSGFPRPWIRLK